MRNWIYRNMMDLTTNTTIFHTTDTIMVADMEFMLLLRHTTNQSAKYLEN